MKSVIGLANTREKESCPANCEMRGNSWTSKFDNRGNIILGEPTIRQENGEKLSWGAP